MSDTYISVFGDNVIPPSESSYAAVSLTADTQFQWPELAVGEFLLYDMLDVSATGAWSVLLPSAATVSEGRAITFKNLSLSTITLKDADLNTIGTLATGEVKTLYLTDNSTDAGTWGLIALGAGTTVADANALAGDGLTVNVGKLAVAAECVLSATDVTLSLAHWARVLLSTNTGTVTYTLPNGTATYTDYFFHVANQGTGTLSLLAQVGQTIDGASAKSLQPGESATVVYAGGSTNTWFTVGYGRSTQFQFTKLVLDISSGTPFTLTSTQAQNKLMQFIGTATEAITVNVPQIVAVYYLECSYAGAFPLTIKTASGAGVTLGKDDRAIVYCDGIDIVVAQTTIGTANLSGGVAGAVVYQEGVSTTGFTAAGTTGQPLISGGAAAPSFYPSLVFGGTSLYPRLLSDFAAAPVASRVLFETSTGAATDVGAHPPNAGSTASYTVYGSHLSNLNTNNSSALSMTIIDGLGAYLNSYASGTGTPLDLILRAGGGEKLRISADSTGTYTFNGTAPRLVADFSNATESSRAMFRSSTTNGTTCVGAVPNGTGAQACFTAYGAADPSNAAYSQITVTATQSKIIAGKTGAGSYKPLVLRVNNVDQLSLDLAGNTLHLHPSGGLGYGVGAGGVVTQATSKSTAVTLNKPCGQITMNNAALGAGSSVAFALNNSLLTIYDVISVTGVGVLSAGYRIESYYAAAGACAIRVTNITAGSLSDALSLNFVIIKGSIA